MSSCAICGVVPGTAIQFRAAKGAGNAVLCVPCHEGIVVDAMLRARSCDGCRSFVAAVDRATRMTGGRLNVVVPSFPSHVGDCRGLGGRLLGTVPRPFAAWSQRRAWLVKAKIVKERFFGTTVMRPLLSAYRDEWLVGLVAARSVDAGEPKFAGLTEAAGLAASLGATQVRIVVDVFSLGDLAGKLSDRSLSADPRARPALMALDWDGVRQTTRLELRCYAMNDHGDVVFDDDVVPLPPDATVDGELPELARRVTREPHLFAPLQFVTWMRQQGHGVEVDPLPSGLARHATRVGAAHRQQALRALLARLGIDGYGLPDPHRVVLVVPAGDLREPQWQLIGMYASHDKALAILRTHQNPPQGFLVDLDATHHPVRPMVLDRQRRLDLGAPRSLEDCGPEWLTTTFGPAAPLTQSDSLETEPPDLPGPAL